MILQSLLKPRHDYALLLALDDRLDAQLLALEGRLDAQYDNIGRRTRKLLTNCDYGLFLFFV